MTTILESAPYAGKFIPSSECLQKYDAIKVGDRLVTQAVSGNYVFVVVSVADDGTFHIRNEADVSHLKDRRFKPTITYIPMFRRQEFAFASKRGL